jgi:hypothetical protein
METKKTDNSFDLSVHFTFSVQNDYLRPEIISFSSKSRTEAADYNSRICGYFKFYLYQISSHAVKENNLLGFFTEVRTLFPA